MNHESILGEWGHSSALLTLALDGDDWSTSSPIPLPPEPMNSLGGPQSQSQCFKEEKNLLQLSTIKL